MLSDAFATAQGGPKIVDFSTHLTGPIASSLLREMGAAVIKVERPGPGDGNRKHGPMISGVGKFHAGLNPGARSLSISTKSPHWPEVVAACAQWADAVIVGGRPQVLRARGMDFASLRKVSPNLVYCSITGYGESGPWEKFPAHGINPDAFAGLVPINWHEGMPAIGGGYLSAGTPLAGVFAALGILGALLRREKGQPAEYVSVSLWGAAMWWNWRDLNLLANTGQARNDYQNLGSRYAVYPTSDVRAIIICPVERAFWERFCHAADLPQLATVGDWTNNTFYGHESERAIIAAAMRKHPMQYWITKLTDADVPFAPCLTAQEAMDSAQSQATGVMRHVDIKGQDSPIVASPVRLSPDDSRVAMPAHFDSPPDLGEHNAQILRDIGLDHLAEDPAVLDPSA